jgi:hypothetical protein
MLIQGFPLSRPVFLRIRFKKLHSVRNEHSSALKRLLGLPVQRSKFDMQIDFEGPIPHSQLYRMSSLELE